MGSPVRGTSTTGPPRRRRVRRRTHALPASRAGETRKKPPDGTGGFNRKLLRICVARSTSRPGPATSGVPRDGNAFDYRLKATGKSCVVALVQSTGAVDV